MRQLGGLFLMIKFLNMKLRCRLFGVVTTSKLIDGERFINTRFVENPWQEKHY